MNKIERLAKAHLFAGLSAGELAELTAGGEELSLEAGEYIYRQGEEGGRLLLCCSGRGRGTGCPPGR